MAIFDYLRKSNITSSIQLWQPGASEARPGGKSQILPCSNVLDLPERSERVRFSTQYNLSLASASRKKHIAEKWRFEILGWGL